MTPNACSTSSTQVDVVLPGGYGAERAIRVVEMAELSDGAVIFFGIDPALPAIAAHLQQDGRAVFVRDGAIVLARARQERLADVAAIIENDSSVILGQGLAYDRCQVGVVTNIDDADHLGDFDINDAERMFNVFRTQVDVVLPGGYGAERARSRVVEMAELSDGAVIFFGIDPALPAIAAHLQQDGAPCSCATAPSCWRGARARNAWPTWPRSR